MEQVATCSPCCPCIHWPSQTEFVWAFFTSVSYLSDEGGLPDDVGTDPTSSGLGDSMMNFQYSPAANLTASPIIPDSIGLTGSLLAPTGDADKGLGGDNWQVNIGAGWSYKVFEKLYLLPSVSYGKSIDEGDLGEPYEEFSFSLGVRWVFDNGLWLVYRPDVLYDLEAHDWTDDHYLILGKMFPGGFGLAVEYGRADSLNGSSSRDDYSAVLRFYYQFGRAP